MPRPVPGSFLGPTYGFLMTESNKVRDVTQNCSLKMFKIFHDYA